jgi:hypothetical protein
MRFMSIAGQGRRKQGGDRRPPPQYFIKGDRSSFYADWPIYNNNPSRLTDSIDSQIILKELIKRPNERGREVSENAIPTI